MNTEIAVTDVGIVAVVADEADAGMTAPNQMLAQLKAEPVVVGDNTAFPLLLRVVDADDWLGVFRQLFGNPRTGISD